MTNSEEFIAELKRQLEENTQKDFINELANLLYNNQPKIDFTDPFSIANFLYDSGYRKVKGKENNQWTLVIFAKKKLEAV